MDLLTPSFGLFIWTLLAFVLVFLILRKFAWGPILSALNEREKTIADSLATAERVKTEMAMMKSENEALLAKAREERSAMLKEAKETRDRIVNEAKDQAKQEAAKILADANAALQNQKMAVLTDVKNQIGNMVIDISEKVIRRSLDSKGEQENYIRQLADDVQLLSRK
jgi:F-type H+-transporting ATPase subunit b